VEGILSKVRERGALAVERNLFRFLHAGVLKEIRDRVQNHALHDVASKHYDRYDFLPDKRGAGRLAVGGSPHPGRQAPVRRLAEVGAPLREGPGQRHARPAVGPAAG